MRACLFVGVRIPRGPRGCDLASLSQMIDDDAGLNFEEAFYLCIITATTVGYGDIGVSDSRWARVYASVHILYSVSSLAALLNTVQVLYAERRIQLRKNQLLQRQLDVELIQSLDKDGNGLDKLEFVVGCSLSLCDGLALPAMTDSQPGVSPHSTSIAIITITAHPAPFADWHANEVGDFAMG